MIPATAAMAHRPFVFSASMNLQQSHGLARQGSVQIRA